MYREEICQQAPTRRNRKQSAGPWPPTGVDDCRCRPCRPCFSWSGRQSCHRGHTDNLGNTDTLVPQDSTSLLCGELHVPGPARALAAGGSSHSVRRRDCFERLLSAVECFPPGAERHQLGFAEQGAKARHQHHQKICTSPQPPAPSPQPPATAAAATTRPDHSAPVAVAKDHPAPPQQGRGRGGRGE